MILLDITLELCFLVILGGKRLKFSFEFELYFETLSLVKKSQKY